MSDLKFVWRTLVHARAFAVTAVATIAVSSAATTTVVAMADAVLLHPISVPQLDRLVVVRESIRPLGLIDAPIDAPSAVDILARRDAFDEGFAFETIQQNLDATDRSPFRATIARTLGDAFGVLGARPAVGQLYAASASTSSNRVAVLSYRFWQTHFGGDSAVVGRTVSLNDQPYLVLGVAAQSLRFPPSADLFAPYPVDSTFERSRGRRMNMTVVGRVAPSLASRRLTESLDRQANQWAEDRGNGPNSAAKIGLSLNAVPLVTFLAGQLQPTIRILLGAVVLVLLIACANVACLQLVRSATRAHEMGVRSALGADGFRLSRLVAVEALLLGGIGVALGTALAGLAVVGISDWGATSYPQLAGMHVNLLVFSTAAGATLATALISAWAPVARVRRTDPRLALGEHRTTGGVERSRVLRMAVTVQVALAASLALGAGVVTTSLARILQVNPGFRSEDVITGTVALPRSSFPTPLARAQFYAQVVDRLRATGGISSASIVSFLPFSGIEDSSPFTIVGHPTTAEGTMPHANYNIVGDDYFATMGIGLRTGRVFSSTDSKSSPPVAVVDEQLAREFFPGSNPVGQHILWGTTDYELIGVVGTVLQEQLGARPQPTIYFSAQNQGPVTATIVVHSALPIDVSMNEIRTSIASADSHLPVYDLGPMATRVSASLDPRRLMTLAIGVFAGLALALATIGIYGVLSYVVARRTKELTIRSVLGADPTAMMRTVLFDGFRLTFAGLGLGVGLFALLERGTATVLYGVGLFDPLALLPGTVTILAAVLIAAWLPARRAGHLDPATAVRSD